MSVSISPAWRDRLAVIGGVAAAVVAAKAARLLWLRAQLIFGPVLVSRYQGQFALVTGASEGLGKAIATSLAKHGLNVILVSRSQQKLDAAAAEIRSKYPAVEVRTIAADLSKLDNCRKLLQQLKGTPIRVLVANAGGGSGKGFATYWEYTDSEEAAIQSLNGTACYSLTRGLLPDMIAAAGGAIVGISSVMSKWGIMAAPYGAEKAKINALMESLDGELRIHGHTGVTAQAMVIGAVATPATAKMMMPSCDTSNPSELSKALSSKEMAQFAPADAVGEAVVRAIGRVGPVVTPYWRHALMVSLVFESWWPPSLKRAVQRQVTRRMLKSMTKAQPTSAAATADATAVS